MKITTIQTFIQIRHIVWSNDGKLSPIIHRMSYTKVRFITLDNKFCMCYTYKRVDEVLYLLMDTINGKINGTPKGVCY